MSIMIDSQFRERLRYGTDDFPIGFFENELSEMQDYTFPLHWHPEFEILSTIDHEIDYQVDQAHYLLSPGDSIFVNGNVLHGLRQIPAPSYEQLPNIVFSSMVVASETSVITTKYIRKISTCESLPCIVLRKGYGWHDDVLALLDEVYTHMRSHDECYEMIVQRCLIEIFEAFYEHFDELPRIEASRRQINTQVRIQQMLDYIQTHYSDRLTLDSIAAAAGISRSEAGRCFKSYMNCTPMDVVTQHRLSTARKLLVETDLTILEISMACGFNSEHYFSRAFHDYYGTSPGKIRNLGK